MGDFTWTRWSRFETLELQFDNPNQPPIIEPENFENSFRYTLGVRWTLSPAWQLRMGTAFDDEAVSSPEFRRPRIPDTDRVWLAAGVGYRPWTNVRIDFGYAHLWGLGVSSDAADAVTGHVLRGEYTGAGADIFGLQLTYDFGPEWLGAPTGGS
jgi:long-chain fatty acid transport protein